jgi:hypothetical protein
VSVGLSDASKILQRKASSKEWELEELLDEAERNVERRDKATKDLYALSLEGKVRFVEPSPPASVPAYLLRPYAMWFWAIVLLILLTASSIYLLPATPPYVYVRYITGSAFLLYLPGYSLIEALYAKKDELDDLERLALSVGLSLALVPLVGLVLNYTPWGIRLEPSVISLSILTLALSLVSARRKLGYIRLKELAGQ